MNSLAIAKRLQAAERENRAAEEIALVFQEFQDANLQQVATKEFVAISSCDLSIAFCISRLEMRTQFAKLRLEHRAACERLRDEMTMRMGAMLTAAVAVLGGIEVLF